MPLLPNTVYYRGLPSCKSMHRRKSLYRSLQTTKLLLYLVDLRLPSPLSLSFIQSAKLYQNVSKIHQLHSMLRTSMLLLASLNISKRGTNLDKVVDSHIRWTIGDEEPHFAVLDLARCRLEVCRGWDVTLRCRTHRSSSCANS